MPYDLRDYSMAADSGGATASATLPVIRVKAQIFDGGSGTLVANLSADANCVNLPADLALLPAPTLLALLTDVAPQLLLIKAGLS